MARQTKADKQLNDAIDEAFRRHGHGVQFNIMDLGNITSDVKAAVRNAQ